MLPIRRKLRSTMIAPDAQANGGVHLLLVRFAALLALAALWLGGLSAARAAATVFVWPPSGNSTQLAYPSSQWPCESGNSWGHSVATNVFDSGSGSIYVYYYDVHSGWTVGNAWWSSMYFVDTKNSVTDIVWAPPVLLISEDWTQWKNTWYGYTSASYEFRVETRFTHGAGGACLGISYVVFRH